MVFNEIITLLEETKTVNEYGDPVVTVTEHVVFAALKSVAQTEFYQAQTAGYKPELKFVIADYLDYHGEDYLKYTSYGGTAAVYHVIRTYRDGNTLEITVQKGVEE